MSHLTFVVAVTALAQSAGPAKADRPPITYESLLREMIDRDAIARFPDPAYTCRQASSYDRAAVSPDKPDTWFANGDANQFIRIDEKDGRKEWVLMDAAGPGAVVRFEVTGSNPEAKKPGTYFGIDCVVVAPKGE